MRTHLLPGVSLLVALSLLLGAGVSFAQEAPKAPAGEKKEAAPAAKPPQAKAAEPAKPGETPKPPEPAKAEAPSKPEVQISNIRFVTSEFGPAVASPVFQPGEKVIARYEISKFQTDVEGRSNLNVQHTIKSLADGKDLGTNEVDIKTICAQGPPVIWSAKAALPPGTPAGKYSFEIKIVDNLIGRKGSANANFEIGPPKLAAVNARLTADREGKMELPPVVALGQRAYLQLTVVGLKVDQGAVRVALSAEAQGPDGLYRRIFKAQPSPVSAEGADGPPVPTPPILLNNTAPGKTHVNVEIHDLSGNATVTLPLTYEVLKSN